jgi:twitching motility protein PilT
MDIGPLLKKLMDGEASDLHLGAGMIPCFRLHNRIIPVPEETRALENREVEQMLFAALTQEQQSRLQQNQELNLSLAYGGGRFRINVHRQRGSWAAVFRKIPSEIPALKDLGLPDIVAGLALKESGLILVTGPTNSGKSTTLAAMVESINLQRDCHIITIEDPIEFVFKNKRAIIKQREVGTDTPSFSAALQGVFRQDPDVIVLGEMNGQEAIATALTAAGTGRLVLGALHTSDAVSTVDRLIESFPAEQQSLVRIQVASSLEGVVCQQLANRAGREGRVLATEIFISTPSIRNLIRTGKSFLMQNDIEVGKRFGMQSMNQALQQLIAGGDIKLEEAIRHTRLPEAFLNKLGVPT